MTTLAPKSVANVAKTENLTVSKTRAMKSGVNAIKAFRLMSMRNAHSARISTRPPIMYQTSALSARPTTSASSGSRKSASSSVK